MDQYRYVNLCQKLLFLHQLAHNMKTDCLLNYKFNTWKFQAQTRGEHVVYRNCFWHLEQFLYTTWSPHVLQKEELLTKIYLYSLLENQDWQGFQPERVQNKWQKIFTFLFDLMSFQSLGQKPLQIFCWFFGDLKTPKGHFEITWPLVTNFHLIQSMWLWGCHIYEFS